MPVAQTFIIGLCAEDVKNLQAGAVLSMPGEEVGIAGVTFLLVYREAETDLAVEVARLRDVGNANPLPDAAWDRLAHVEQAEDKSIEHHDWGPTLLVCKMAGPAPQDWGLLGYANNDPPGSRLRELRRVKGHNKWKLEKELESMGYRPLKKGDPDELWSGDGLENWSKQ